MHKQALIVIGTSAGGIPALLTLIRGLSKDFDTPICIARHCETMRPSELPDILTRLGTLPVTYPQSGEKLLGGHIFLAPPDHQLLVEREKILVVRRPLQQPRDDIDLLFQSAAHAYTSQVIAVILTGRLTDGTRGLQIVKWYGGITIIQGPEKAAFPSMPQSALEHCIIDYCLPLAQLAPLLQKVT